LQWWKKKENFAYIKKSLFFSFIGLTQDGSISFNNINNLNRMEKQQLKIIEHDLKKRGELANDEFILGIFEESCLRDIMGDLHCLLASNLEGDDSVVNVHSKEFYEEIKKIVDKNEVYVGTKYKTMAKKVKPMALPLPFDCEEKAERAFKQPNLKDPRKVGHEFYDIKWFEGWM
jgi:hypothetical protein